MFCLVLLFACSAAAEIRKYEDDDGVIHFSDDSGNPKFKPVFQASPSKPLVLGEYICKERDRAGNLWAVRKTDNRQYFMWYMNGNREVAVLSPRGLVVPSLGEATLDADGVVVGHDPVVVWERGTSAYKCFMAVMKSSKRR